ncbi:MAG: hypothetical protein ACRDSR_11750 [Pseudonocardiaceae bacterium]
MTLRRLSGSKDEASPGLWGEDQILEDVIAVGTPLDPSPVPLGEGEVAIRFPRRLIRDAGIGCPSELRTE